MKNFLKVCVVCIVAFVSSSSSGFAQFYLQVGAGYGLDLGGVTLGGGRRIQVDTNTTYETIAVSFASGIRFGGNAGYMFTKSFGAELGAYYMPGQEAIVTESKRTTSSSTSISTSKGTGSGLFLTPSLVFSTEFGGISPFARFGAVVGFPKLKMNSSMSYSGSGGTSEESGTLDQTVSGGVAIGFAGGAGIILPLGEKFSILADVTSTTLSYAPTKLTIDRITENGKDEPIPDSEKEVDLVSSRKHYEENDITASLPFSSISFNLGFRFNF